MESANPSSSAPPYSEGAGAGGKFRKPPISRKRPCTPYDRPSLTAGSNRSDDSQDGGGGWLSKLVVNPARRLIVGGATRVLPSFFTKSDSSSADEHEDDPHGDQDNQDIDASVNACSDAKHNLEVGVSRWSGDAGHNSEMDKLKGSSEHNDVTLDKSKNSNDDLGLDKIENMLKGKQFSRDERNRLMEILNSRLVDVSSTEERKAPSVISQGQAKEDTRDRETPCTLTMGKQYDVDRALLETPMPHSKSNMQDEVAASPIDIARAYMGSRTSEPGFNTYSIMSKDGREQQHNNLFSSKPHILTPSSKSSTCWPGAMVQDQRGYLTPQSQRGRYGLHNFPRTPYSRTVYSRTKPKPNQLQADSRSTNIPLTTFQQSRTPNYGQMMSSSDVMDSGYGSVGPMRRVRNKFTSEPRSGGPSGLFSAKVSSSSMGSRSLLPVFQKNPETAGTCGTSNVHTADGQEQTFKGEATAAGPSDDMVRKILEQLDRHTPTPKEKAAELKLATEWRRPPSQDTTLITKESTILATVTGPDLQTSGVSNDNRSSVKRPNGGVSFKGIPDPTKASNAATKTSSPVGAGAGPSFGLWNNTVADEKSTFITNSKENEKSQPWSLDNQKNGVDETRKRPSQPFLKPIFFKRPDPQQVVSADNGRGFTFPFSATSSSTVEPPTPSIMPSFTATGADQQQLKQLPVIPTYSFGTKKSGERIVFSFPSTSNAAIDDGESSLKFKFGSDKKRVSFSSTDAVVIN